MGFQVRLAKQSGKQLCFEQQGKPQIKARTRTSFFKSGFDANVEVVTPMLFRGE
jgi:hypothetical protein